jgi:hypothetical protein
MTSAKKCALAALLAIIAVALLMASGIDDRADRVRQLEPTSASVVVGQ